MTTGGQPMIEKTQGPEADFYVATNGNDTWSGTLPDQTLVVKEAESGEAARLAGGHIRFPTRAGQTYLIEPATP